ncbi:MAG: hypothetical protein ABJ242_02905 [Marinomonas sp.]
MHHKLELFACFGALLLSGCANSSALAPIKSAAAMPETSTAADRSNFIGDYTGNSFETAMGMRLAEDGTFNWRLSVGALDMRAKGSWQQQGETITLTSDPKPLPARFNWSGFEKAEGGKLVKVVWAETGKPFAYATAGLICSDGSRITAQVPAEGWSPDPAKCPKPVSLTLQEGIYKVRSEPYDLAAFDMPQGTTIRFAFERNDLGVADFTGMTGRLEDNMLKFTGGSGLLGDETRPRPGEDVLELRKLPPR